MRTFGEKDTQVVVETVRREVPLAQVCLDSVEHLSARGASAMPTSVWDAGLARGAVFDLFEVLGVVLDRGRRGVLEVEGDAVPFGKDAGEVFVNGFGGEGRFPVGSDGFAFVVGGFGEGAVWTLVETLIALRSNGFQRRSRRASWAWRPPLGLEGRMGAGISCGVCDVTL